MISFICTSKIIYDNEHNQLLKSRGGYLLGEGHKVAFRRWERGYKCSHLERAYKGAYM